MNTGKKVIFAYMMALSIAIISTIVIESVRSNCLKVDNKNGAICMIVKATK